MTEKQPSNRRTSPPHRHMTLDAIIVPFTRSVDSLSYAASMARTAGATLVVLCSERNRASAATSFLKEYSDLNLVVAETPQALPISKLPFRASTLLIGTKFVRKSDLSAKRNAGLLLARMAKWRSILFLDDDICGIPTESIYHGLGLLEHYPVIGFPISDYPDCSVLSHALRTVGGSHNKQISGSALLINAQTENLPFFPDIYNEDWLFLYDWIRNGQVAAPLHSEAVQQPYDPFSDPERAREEQFGELIAGGIYWLLQHEGKRPEHADKAFWKRHKSSRLRLVAELTNRCQHSRTHQHLIPTLLTIRRRLEEISPSLLALYVTSWLKDLQDWAANLSELPNYDDLKTALEYLHMEPVFIQAAGRQRTSVEPQIVDLEFAPSHFVVRKSHFIVDTKEVSNSRKSGRSFR